METPAFEKSFKGTVVCYLWKIGLVMTSALPMIGFIACLFVIAIKRDATILISILMMAMLHPVFTLATGVFTKTMGQFLSRKCSKVYKHKILARLFTYSINCHFAMIAILTMYMYKMWSDLSKRAEFAFSDTSFDKCTCDVLHEIGQVCVNRETGYSFQNLFLLVDMQLLLLTFLITSIICHLIQSMFLYFPAPVPLFQFIVGKDNENGSEFRAENLNIESEAKPTKPKALKWVCDQRIKFSWCIIAMAFLIGLVGVPYHGFDKLPGELISTKNGETCPLKFKDKILKIVIVF